MNSDLEEFSVGVHGLLSRQLSQALGSEEAFDALERNIEASMTNVFRSFRRTKNDEAAVNALPEELLALIFQFVDGTALELLELAHVCQHWRSVALSESSLWTRIQLHGQRCKPEILEPLLARTGALPVHLELSVPSGQQVADALALGRAASDHLPRLESLVITGDSGWIGTLQTALVLPAPVLRTLELCDIDANTVAIVQADVFARHTPHLEKLTLTNVVPTIWNNFLFSHLHELTLAGSCLSPSTFDLATCLASIPALRQLSLSCRIRPFPSHSGDELPWSAPALRTLEIAAQEDDAVVNTVLDHLPVSTLDAVTVTPTTIPTMMHLLKGMATAVNALSLTAPSTLSALNVRAVGEPFLPPTPSSTTATDDGDSSAQVARSGLVPSTDGIPCALLFQHLDAPFTSSITHLTLSYELWPYALPLSLPVLATLVIPYTAVPPPTYQLSLFLNPGPQHASLSAPVLSTLALTAPSRSPIKLATLVYLVTRALKFDAEMLEELVLVNIFAEEEPGNADGLSTIFASAKRLLFLPELPSDLQI
ncbi:hypothetical protein EXIGLDRAFT_462708 [Exidia glandulosa HHB12029]|uniref:F-box domain-containing protein n=1 Tax=Exidia glandulosa HHB12029 TaxID=1314781 RepID=A0A165K3Y7_EXIGL|nr:hypothetical protein EXIGLDRAFT_462708 [Exidia glandulosa HHB12029]